MTSLAPSIRRIDELRLTKRMDDLWGRLVKARASYRCERCHGKSDVQAAHIITRARKLTRWDLSNGLALDAGCHLAMHRNPLEFYEFVDQLRGAGTVDRLRILSQPGRVKVDVEMEWVRLKAAARELGVKG